MDKYPSILGKCIIYFIHGENGCFGNPNENRQSLRIEEKRVCKAN